MYPVPLKQSIHPLRGCRQHDARTLTDGQWLVSSGRRESGFAATAVASAPVGADAHPRDESIACCGAQRRSAAQESIMAAGRSPGIGVVDTGSLGQPTTPRPARLTRSIYSEDPGTDP